ncbi:AMP-dependent synthetase and ligase [Bradyrhizobium sp. STM 3843]|uniref:AMP-binding protein n=1 Tax=Bradyrhizobium sp. STM 3843 TaxID=551947 RepID=UPI000240491A|nr:AMP-binding protein [Bradyrhizobium sp. STM 3843]CCE08028.1 AMP-dependent synthetase and ligase [Bradyrhizobium sp. STM 3843]
MADLRSFSDPLSYQAADRSQPILDLAIGDVLRTAADSWPHRTALVDGSPHGRRHRWTFTDLLRDAEAVARALLHRFAPGEHVAIWSANQPEWVLIEFGAALAGLTLVTVNPAYLRDELAFVLRQSQACGVIVQDSYRNRDLLAIIDDARTALPALREVIPLSSWPAFIASRASASLPAVACNDVAQIQYTSGTTGAPKGARLTHRNLANNARLFAQTIGADDHDVWINPMPMFHTAGCSLITLGALQTGGTHVLPPGFDADLMLRLIEEERGTISGGVPTMLGRMLDSPALDRHDLSSWRKVMLGGAPVPPELVRRAQARGLTVVIGFGQTEASPYVTHTLPDDPHPDWITTVGRPLPQTEIKIIDPDSGETLPRGRIGEICARGYSVMKDYFNDPQGTASAIDADGWLHTGDLGSLDDYGYCRVQGRRRDLIIRGGENIYPREIEDVLHTHPAVLDASVVGIPDADWGEVPVGFVILKPNQQGDADELMQFCRARLASYKVPRTWRFVAQFPQTASGKIQKFKLRDDYLGGDPAR